MGRSISAAETATETVRETVETVDEAARVRAILAAADGSAVAPVELYRAISISRATFHRRATEWIAQGGWSAATASTGWRTRSADQFAFAQIGSFGLAKQNCVFPLGSPWFSCSGVGAW
jgi:hypothetical protein